MSVAPPLLPGNYTSLRIDSPVEGAEQKVELQIYEDIYKAEFYPYEHFHFMGTDDTGAHFVVSIKDQPQIGSLPPIYDCITTTKKGYTQFQLQINLSEGEDISTKLDVLERVLPNSVVTKDAFYPVLNEYFKDELVKIEEQFPQKKTKMKIGMIFCKKGQTSPLEMFKNGLEGGPPVADQFWTFLNALGEEVDLSNNWTGYTGDMKGGKTYYTRWKQIEVIYHVAPLLKGEAHRRLIGNDIAVIFFLEEGDNSLFDPSQISALGTVPQVFAVVQPVGQLYRVAFFSNINIKKFSPDVPVKPLTIDEVKDIVLTKMHNGLIMVNSCPPMNRLFYIPRQAALDSLSQQYPVLPAKEKKAYLKKLKKEKKITLEDSQVTFENDQKLYSVINSLVLLVASNLAYLDVSVIPARVEKELGLTVVKTFEDTSVNIRGYIASDNDKILIVFGGMNINLKHFKKTLKEPRVPFKITLHDKSEVALKGTVYRHFANCVYLIWPMLYELLLGSPNKNQNIWLSGHSLGGAVAMLMAHVLAEEQTFFKQFAGIYTYGCPKVGDEIWSKTYNLLLANITHRVVNSNDSVPHMGSKRDNWAHAGTTYLITPDGSISDSYHPTHTSLTGHQIASYFNVLTPRHKEALEAMKPEDVKRDRIYSKNNFHSYITFEDRRKHSNNGDHRRLQRREKHRMIAMNGENDPNDPDDPRQLRRSKSLASLNGSADLTQDFLRFTEEELTATRKCMSVLGELLGDLTGDFTMSTGFSPNDIDLNPYIYLVPRQNSASRAQPRAQARFVTQVVKTGPARPRIQSQMRQPLRPTNDTTELLEHETDSDSDSYDSDSDSSSLDELDSDIVKQPSQSHLTANSKRPTLQDSRPSAQPTQRPAVPDPRKPTQNVISPKVTDQPGPPTPTNSRNNLSKTPVKPTVGGPVQPRLTNHNNHNNHNSNNEDNDHKSNAATPTSSNNSEDSYKPRPNRELRRSRSLEELNLNESAPPGIRSQNTNNTNNNNNIDLSKSNGRKEGSGGYSIVNKPPGQQPQQPTQLQANLAQSASQLPNRPTNTGTTYQTGAGGRTIYQVSPKTPNTRPTDLRPSNQTANTPPSPSGEESQNSTQPGYPGNRQNGSKPRVGETAQQYGQKSPSNNNLSTYSNPANSNATSTPTSTTSVSRQINNNSNNQPPKSLPTTPAGSRNIYERPTNNPANPRPTQANVAQASNLNVSQSRIQPSSENQNSPSRTNTSSHDQQNTPTRTNTSSHDQQNTPSRTNTSSHDQQNTPSRTNTSSHDQQNRYQQQQQQRSNLNQSTPPVRNETPGNPGPSRVYQPITSQPASRPLRRSKSTNDLEQQQQPQQPQNTPQNTSQSNDEKSALSIKLKRLIDQLKSTLGIILNLLKKLHSLDLSRPSPQIILVLENIDKPNDACFRLAQFLQNGHIDSESFDKKITAFTRVSPKFKQVGDAFKRGATPAGVSTKLFTEILVLFMKVISEVIDSMDSIVVEDKIRAAKL